MNVNIVQWLCPDLKYSDLVPVWMLIMTLALAVPEPVAVPGTAICSAPASGREDAV
jgi:hypothetical protein